MKKRFSEEQVIGFLREAEAGIAVKDLCRRHGFSEASYYLWRSKFGGMSVPDAKRLKDLEAENARLKKLLAEQLFENDLIKDALRKMLAGAPARCALVRQWMQRGASERRALAIIGMSASALRYVRREERNVRVERAHLGLGASAQALRRRNDLSETAAARMHRELQARGTAVSGAVAAGQAAQAQEGAGRRAAATAAPGPGQSRVVDGLRVRPYGRRPGHQCLVIVDDATHEVVAIEVERATSGHGISRVLDRLSSLRGLQQVIRTDNDKEFCSKVMVSWAHARGAQLRLIQPGKPNQNAYVESFNGRLRDECLNKQWFPTLLHVRTEIERWRREHNEERPKDAIGGMTPAVYAKHLANIDIINPDSKPDYYSRRGDVERTDIHAPLRCGRFDHSNAQHCRHPGLAT